MQHLKRCLTLCVLGCFVAIAGCPAIHMYSKDEMNALGEAAFEEKTGYGATPPAISSGAAYEALQRVGRAISAAADAEKAWGYEWEFRLLDDSSNGGAWAMPGGKIAFYTGIYKHLKDEAGMAIVMGHEVQHALLQHSNARMSKGALANLAIFSVAAGFHTHEQRDLIVAALGGALAADSLRYARDEELEADKAGLLLAARAGYDPEAAIGVWQRMSKKRRATPEFMSTHPDPGNRIAALRALMPEAKALYKKSVKQPNRPLPPIAKAATR